MRGTRRAALRIAWPWLLGAAFGIVLITLVIRWDPVLATCMLLICITQLVVFTEAYRIGHRDGLDDAARAFWSPSEPGRRREESFRTLVVPLPEPSHVWVATPEDLPKPPED